MRKVIHVTGCHNCPFSGAGALSNCFLVGTDGKLVALSSDQRMEPSEVPEACRLLESNLKVALVEED